MLANYVIREDVCKLLVVRKLLIEDMKIWVSNWTVYENLTVNKDPMHIII